MSGGKRARSSADRRRWREQPANERIAYANKLIILHPRFREAVDLLGRCHQGSQQAREPYCGAVLGASGVGKTSVVDHYLRQHPSQETDTSTRQPVLKVTLQPNASPKGIAADLLLAAKTPAILFVRHRTEPHYCQHVSVSWIRAEECGAGFTYTGRA